MPVVDWTHVRISRIGTALAGWIGDHHFGLGANVGVGFTQGDGVAVTLGHFAAVEAGNPRRLREHRLRLDQNIPNSRVIGKRAQSRPEIIKSYRRNVLAN